MTGASNSEPGWTEVLLPMTSNVDARRTTKGHKKPAGAIDDPVQFFAIYPEHSPVWGGIYGAADSSLGGIYLSKERKQYCWLALQDGAMPHAYTVEEKRASAVSRSLLTDIVYLAAGVSNIDRPDNCMISVGGSDLANTNIIAFAKVRAKGSTEPADGNAAQVPPCSPRAASS
jgi:hypothetical protein